MDMFRKEYESIDVFKEVIEKLCNCKINYCTKEEYDSFPPEFKKKVGDLEIVILFPNNNDVDNFWEKYEELKNELESLKNFLEKTESKLSDNFITKAPKEIVDKDFKKWCDTISKMNFTLSVMISMLSKRADLIEKQENT